MRSFSQAKKKKFNELGYFLENNYLKKNLDKKLYKSFEKMKFKKIYQKRNLHYSHVFKSNYIGMPTSNEPFIARFSVGLNPEKNEKFINFWKENLIPDLKKLTNNKAKYFLIPNVYKLGKGDVFRCHIDDYAGICGYTFYLNKDWKWDYGGILNLAFKDGSTDQIFPINNRIMFRNEKKKLYHFLPEIPKYVKNKYQYLVVGWAADKKFDESKLRGQYHYVK